MKIDGVTVRECKAPLGMGASGFFSRDILLKLSGLKKGRALELRPRKGQTAESLQNSIFKYGAGRGRRVLRGSKLHTSKNKNVVLIWMEEKP